MSGAATWYEDLTENWRYFGIFSHILGIFDGYFRQNAVLFLCPNTAAVVEFVSGEDYLLKSVRPEVTTDRHS